MQRVLSEVADQAGRTSHFVQRASKMGGAEFVQTLVFGWMSNPEATLAELSQTAATLGVRISPQGLEQRFTEAAADCLKAVLDQAVTELVQGTCPAESFLQRFSGVYIQDSSVVKLPDEFSERWSGCGNQRGQGLAAVKIEVRLDLLHGAMIGPFLEDGRVHDAVSRVQSVALPAGALSMADLGYWSLAEMDQQAQRGAFWLSRMMTRAKVLTMEGQVWDILDLLRSQSSNRLECEVFLSLQHRLPARLLAVRVPQEVADRRRQKLREQATKNSQSVSPRQLALADWTILVTNAPPELLTLRQALILMRLRWQVELLFKLWKSHGRIDEWRSAKPWRILCEVYAKLLVMLLQHWLFLVGFWHHPDRSLFKAACTLQRQALFLAWAFPVLENLIAAIVVIQRCLEAGGRIYKRKSDLRAFQLLQILLLEPLA